MNKRTQKIVSITIGLILSGLLIYIGIRIVQERSSRASVPENFTCERITKTEAQCRWTSKDEGIGRVLYGSVGSGGTGSCNLVFISEEVNAPVSVDGGNFEHTVQIGPLVSDERYCAAVGGNEDGIVEIPSSGVGEQAVEPTAVPVVEPTAIPEPTEPAAEEPEAAEPTDAAPTSSPTENDEIKAYYEDNDGATYKSCLEHFQSQGKDISARDCIVNYPSE